jgi:hypothetical protein
MKQIRSSKTLAMAAAMLTLGVLSTVTASAAYRPIKTLVLRADPAVMNSAWTKGVSRDGGRQSLQLGLRAGNDRYHPTYFRAHYTFPEWWMQKLTDVRKISASFLAPASTINYGGSPRFNLEVANADGTPLLDEKMDPIVIYLDPAWCSKPAPGGWRDADFIGNKAGSIFDSRGMQYTGDGRLSAWKKLIADPYYAGKKVGFLYLMQDASVGPNFVDKITLDGAVFTKQP